MSKNSVQKVVARHQSEISSGENREAPPTSIYDVMAKLSPHLTKPVHFDPYVRSLDRAILEGGVELCFHGPPQHGKTEISKHAYIFAAIVKPGRTHAYTSFSDDRAQYIMGQIVTLAQLAGLNPRTKDGILFLDGGTAIKFGGCGTGALTGWPLPAGSLHIIDDPIKDRVEANSPTIRERRWDWMIEVAESRKHPGASTVVMMARWHLDDLSGRCHDRLGWEYIRIPAICDSADDPIGRKIGEALFSQLHPIEVLLRRRAQEPIKFEGLYQGNPREIGDALFGPPTFYDSLPEKGEPYVTAYGADLAYTEKTRADWSVLIRGRRYLWSGFVYLTGVWRKQWQADKFNALMRTHIQMELGRCIWFCASAELGTAQLIRGTLPSFTGILAQGRGDPYARALPVAEQGWNEPNQKILIPRLAGWKEAFVKEVADFTGVEDAHDDQVAALAGLWHALGNFESSEDFSAFNKQLAARYGRGLRGRDRNDER